MTVCVGETLVVSVATCIVVSRGAKVTRRLVVVVRLLVGRLTDSVKVVESDGSSCVSDSSSDSVAVAVADSETVEVTLCRRDVSVTLAVPETELVSSRVMVCVSDGWVWVGVYVPVVVGVVSSDWERDLEPLTVMVKLDVRKKEAVSVSVSDTSGDCVIVSLLDAVFGSVGVRDTLRDPPSVKVMVDDGSDREAVRDDVSSTVSESVTVVLLVNPMVSEPAVIDSDVVLLVPVDAVSESDFVGSLLSCTVPVPTVTEIDRVASTVTLPDTDAEREKETGGETLRDAEAVAASVADAEA